jgi:hypothetical protein
MNAMGEEESEHCKQRRVEWMSIIRTEQVIRRQRRRHLDRSLDNIFRTLLPPGIARTHIAKFVWWSLPISRTTLEAAAIEACEDNLCARCARLRTESVVPSTAM